MSDPVIEELWQIKDALARECGYSVDTLLDCLATRGQQRQARYVDLAASKHRTTESEENTGPQDA